MSAPEHEHSPASHARYIGEVVHLLKRRDVSATLISMSSPGDRREARLLLRPDQEAFTEPVPAEAALGWDEENGWSLIISADPDVPVAPAPFYKGLSVLPDPEDVAAWVVVVLAHPELTPSRDDHPFRDRAAADPAFEDELARYAARR
jgi:Family of unknown function (DUF6292)